MKQQNPLAQAWEGQLTLLVVVVASAVSVLRSVTVDAWDTVVFGTCLRISKGKHFLCNAYRGGRTVVVTVLVVYLVPYTVFVLGLTCRHLQAELMAALPW